jgi:hypothetical protein
LGKNEDRHRRVRAPDLGRGAQTVVRLAGGHANVDDGDVWEVGAHLQQQLAGITRASHDPMSSRLEKGGDALSEQRVVVGYNDAQNARGVFGYFAVCRCKVA